VLVLAGSYEETYSNTTLQCGPQTAKFRPPEQRHVTRFGPRGAHCLTVELNSAWLARLKESLRLTFDRPACRAVAVSVTLARLRREVAKPDQFTALSVEGLVLELIVEFARGGETTGIPAPPQWLTRARDALEERFSERVGLSALAEDLGIHPVHLACQFRFHYGSSVGEYLRRLRVDRAKALLTHSRMPLVEMALELGFSSQSHFTRAFKRETGIPPGRYRSLQTVS
jgi:AraC family transcriptional regulator